MNPKLTNSPYVLKGLISLALFLVTSMAFSQSFAYKALLKTIYDADLPVLKPEEIPDLDRFQLIDTREKEEYEVSHLEGARWVGYDTFSMDLLDDLDKDEPVLVYCTVGARSQDIGKRLKEAGFRKVFNLYGGIIHWVNEDYPIYHEGKSTNQVHTYTRTWGIWLQKGEKVY
ncbi:rhodanese-like domain-containing protein [Algoriphagus hitonicola]|uniref:Rhodanese-related sulfurtransferase n=1 Tax=Algoriphagus hitonicola TaxID=435880 RepID=A0A1I2TJ67_9BACT|nr:rhodanese-like domain-containing protein [Algoriphagus hitonicola]SFG64890.1 Rhodanese-related sulfurtransferase [Algoriphagus hitonicola]